MKIITIEEHIGLAELDETTANTIGPLTTQRLADMASYQIDMQVLSYAALPKSPLEARSINDKLALLCSLRPDRFAAFAVLEWNDADEAVRELERAATVLRLKGVLLAGRPLQEAVFLDDSRYAPVMEKAAALRMPIYVHPGMPLLSVREPYYGGFSSEVTGRLSTWAWGWHNEAGVHILRLILSGAFDRYPSLRLIAGHWGEMLPFFLARLDVAIPQDMSGLQHPISYYFKEYVYVTPSGMFTLPELQYILQVLGSDKILYSADYPHIDNTSARAFLEGAPISQAEKERIAHGNAELLLGLTESMS